MGEWIVLGGCAAAVVFCLGMLVRNGWVYRQRTALIEADYELYKRLPPYDVMMRKWWLWDAAKFIDMPDPVRSKDRRVRERGEKIARRFRGSPTHD